MNEMEKAYLAGIVDGEGSIFINKAKRGLNLVMAIKMTNKPTIERVAEIMETTFWMNNLTSAGKQSWRTQVTGDKCKSIIRNIQPYLVGKQELSELALEFPIHYKGGPSRYTEVEHTVRQSTYIIMSWLNRYGSGFEVL